MNAHLGCRCSMLASIVFFALTHFWILYLVQGFTHLGGSRVHHLKTHQTFDQNGYCRGYRAHERQTGLILGRPYNRVEPASTLLISRTELSATVFDHTADVLIIGSGPAACAIAALLSSSTSQFKPLDVLLADQNLDREWVPNYGVWKDEWQSIVDRYQQSFGVEIQGGKCQQAVDREWPVTDCFFGGSFDIPTTERLRLNRPYYRVDKIALKKSLSNASFRTLKASHASKAIALNIYAGNTLVHDESGTTVQLRQRDGSIATVRTKLLIDCTGHETSLVLRDDTVKHRPPGYQIAYGVLVEVEDNPSNPQVGPYDKEAMTLFDYRTDHYGTINGDDDSRVKQVESAPTFMYAMPLHDNFVFFEETSLVARPALSFQECKDRCFRRMQYHGIKVKSISEEEYCYIPMGGPLPARDQRIMALGGTAAIVHPSTGYSICRCLMGAADMASAIQNELLLQEKNGRFCPERVAAAAYHSLWSPDNIRQRNFAVYGGEFLMKQNVVGLRGFFDGFFRLPLGLWAGFLAGWPGLPYNEKHESWLARMYFGLSFVIRLPFPVALDMLLSIISYSVSEGTPLLQSVTPFFGEPLGFEHKRISYHTGDVAAKEEARKMIQQSTVVPDVPVAFLPQNIPFTVEDAMVNSPAQGEDSAIGSFQ